MPSIAECVVDALEPYVGRMVAGTCLGATALSLGKTRDELEAADLPTLETNIRNLLSSVAPPATIDAIVADIQVRCV